MATTVTDSDYSIDSKLDNSHVLDAVKINLLNDSNVNSCVDDMNIKVHDNYVVSDCLYNESNFNNGLDSSIDNAHNANCFNNSLHITQPALIKGNQGCVDSEVLAQNNVNQGFSANICNYVNNHLVINDNVCMDNKEIECKLDHVNNSQVCFLNEVIDAKYLSIDDDFSGHYDTNPIDSIVPPPTFF
jgi:hypothetical protein